MLSTRFLLCGLASRSRPAGSFGAMRCTRSTVRFCVLGRVLAEGTFKRPEDQIFGNAELLESIEL